MSTLKQVFFNISFEAFSVSKFLWSVITLMAVFVMLTGPAQAGF